MIVSEAAVKRKLWKQGYQIRETRAAQAKKVMARLSIIMAGHSNRLGCAFAGAGGLRAP